MKIFGGRDYYDSAQAFGHDPSVVLTRKEQNLVSMDYPDIPKLKGNGNYSFNEKTLSRKKRTRYHWRNHYDTINHKDSRWVFSRQEVIFCGKRYIGLKAKDIGSNVDSKVFWSREELNAWLTPMKMEFNSRSYSWRRDSEIFTVTDVTREEMEYLIKNRISIMIWHRYGDLRDGRTQYWDINSSALKDVEFYKVFPPPLAFQELDMWVSGVLGKPAGETVEVSNEIKIAKHGFDDYSFRTPKSKSKRSS